VAHPTEARFGEEAAIGATTPAGKPISATFAAFAEFERELIEALDTPAGIIALHILEYHALSADRCNQSITEYRGGERLLASDTTSDQCLFRRLGM
jgi:hypothetical protein